MHKVIVTDPISDSGIKVLKQYGFDIINTSSDNKDLKTLIKDVDGWIVRSGTKITADMIAEAKKLQVIGRAGVGTDNIDIDAATERGIVVMNVPDGNSISAAEHTMAMLSALSRNIQIGHMTMIDGKWDRHKLIGNELRGKILGIVGLGRIGREVMKRALSYDMKVIGFDPYVNQDMFDKDIIRIEDIDTLSLESDFITVHVPLINSTRDMFDSKRLKMMKKNARIINVARGGIINESDLADALNNDIIAGAAIDVFENEPIEKNHPLLAAKNILLTPHLGASTHEAKDGVSISICKQVSECIVNKKLINALNLPIADASELKKIKDFLNLAELLGKIHAQLIDSSISDVAVECYGQIANTKPILLSFLKGLFIDITSDRVNFINAGYIASDRGISTRNSHSTEETSFLNLIKTTVRSGGKEFKIEGSIFGENHYRITKLYGREIDVRPNGHMIFIKNYDIPGVVGSIGMTLGNHGINIAEFILSRDSSSKIASTIIKVDQEVDSDTADALLKSDQIIEIRKIYI